jgi:hypothetical protein
MNVSDRVVNLSDVMAAGITGEMRAAIAEALRLRSLVGQVAAIGSVDTMAMFQVLVAGGMAAVQALRSRDWSQSASAEAYELESCSRMAGL